MRILLVEDDPDLRQQLEAQLQAAGYVLDLAADGEEGLYHAREYAYDAAIIDLGLPRLGGLELIGRMRAAGIHWPVLILTARGHWQDKVTGLEAGADDYLTKPFQQEELLARLQALLRRAGGHASPALTHGAIVLDMSRRTVRCSDQPVELTAFEFRLLEYFMLNAGRVISKSELTEHLYAQDHDRDSNVIEVLIGRLRRKLEPVNPIQTMRGQGYRLDPDAAT